MVSRPVIREATDVDVPLLEPLIAQLLDAMDDPPQVDQSRLVARCRELLSSRNHHLLVAELDGAVVGFIHMTTRQTLAHEHPSGLIDELTVLSGYRGQGVGRELVRAAVSRCRAQGCCEVEVSTETANTRAREFYRACGFEENGVLLECSCGTDIER